MATFALRSRRVITPDGELPATLKIAGGLIEAVLAYDADPRCPLRDFGDWVLMPGLVDSHVHINEPGRTDWEGFDTATQAAAVGGITTLVDMPLNCIPVTTSKAALLEKLAAVQDKLWVDCGFWGGVVPDSIDDLDDLLNAGVLGVKSFLIDSGISEFPNMSKDDLTRAMPIVAKHSVPYLIHAELEPRAELRAEPRAENQMDSRSYQGFLNSRPEVWELDAIELMIAMCRDMKAKGIDSHVHIVHLSCADAVNNIKQAQDEGLNLTLETCPHYLTLAAEDISDGATLFKCCPPIREEQNRQKLWQALKAGLIDFIVSDHSPCTADLKLSSQGDIKNAWGGISALQFGLPLIWSQALVQGFQLHEVSHLMSSAPADFIGLGKTKGRIAAAYAADVIVFDDACEYEITAQMIMHKNKFTPYEGMRVTGKVKASYLAGHLVYADEKIQGKPMGRPILKQQTTDIL